MYSIMLAIIMLNAFASLLCSKLCWHNQHKPTLETSYLIDMHNITQHCNGSSWITSIAYNYTYGIIYLLST